ncbi:MAG: flagellar hook assembly protein FlgD [Burkholderiales bacterium]|nr:flagellar hook assembly protein FlgD [Burkholderiales bacterium]
MSTIQTDVVDPGLRTTMNGARTSKTTTQEAQDRFMTLLVTQMKNQDPLNPMDNAQVTSQLAQLSTVSGIDKLNASVATLNASFQASQSLQAASMIGHGVIVPGKVIGLTDGKAVYGMELPQAADKVEVTIRDSDGAVVRKMSLGAMPQGVSTLAWDGMTDSGAAAPNGVYQFELAASSAEKKLDAATLSFGMVSSIASSAQGVKLSVTNVGDIGMNDVRQIY